MIRFEHVSKVFETKSGSVEALTDINLEIPDGCIFGIIGLSGAGKSTMVRCMNLLERPTSGSIYFGDTEMTALSKSELRKARRKIGMIFQQFNLLEQRTALENVCYPLEITGMKKADAIKRAEELLEIVSLSDRKDNYPSQLSGGQKQRVAIARALATSPEVLLCDEATSALDPNTTRSILELLQRINRSMGVTIVVITHEMKVVEQICQEAAVLDHGHLVERASVQELFRSPKSAIARQMIEPKNDGPQGGFRSGETTVFRIVFDGQTAYEPVISNLILKCKLTVNIIGARTENIGGKAYGQMLLQLPNDERSLRSARRYLDKIKIHYEEGVTIDD